MNRKFAAAFAALCIAAAIGAAGYVAYRILSQDASGRESARVDFEGLRSVLAYVKDPSDLADPGLRARLASRYEASPGLLFVDVYERGDGDRWRIPAEPPYLDGARRAGGAPSANYPPYSTILLSSPLKGDSSGKLAVDALYVSLTQAAAFSAFRDSLIGLGAFLAVAAFALAIASSAGRKKKPEATFDFSSAPAGESKSGPAGDRIAAASIDLGEADFEEEWGIEDKAAAAAQYQFETLQGTEEADDEFDIPVMDMDLGPKETPAEPYEPESEPERAEPAGFEIEEEPADEEFAPIEGPSGDAAASAAAASDSGQAGAADHAAGAKPAGLFSPGSGLGWESYLKERLDAELSRSASFEQDLSLLVLCHDELSPDDEAYARIAAAIKGFFSFRDLAFERNGDGFSIILPNIDSSHAVRMADEFYKKLVFLAEGDYAELDLMPVYVGISSRAGRLVDAKRLIEEAAAALDRARYEKDTHIVAFRPDPDKYRQFLASKA
jgi:GGDEF domain-containing protein